ncbi:alpha/beta hydrolase family protein [Actinoallomurus sp. CA-142502]|uniref:alpha/beta hydrolase family protein n=1 Tax=Actinoallomurus sp. CA-142502 TaxID=3239885 RepID=UPI003D94F584
MLDISPSRLFGCAVTALLIAGCSSVTAQGASSDAPITRELTFRSGPDTLPATFQPAAGRTGVRPAALIISGSGPTDRDGNDRQFPHLDTNRNFAKALAADRIASLRYDKLGSGQAGTENHPGGRGIDFDLFAQEALDAYRTMARQPGVDPHRLIVVGHSEGGLLALWLADRLRGTSEAPRAVVLAAPIGIRYLDLLSKQLTEQYRAAQAAGRLSAQQVASLLDELRETVSSIRKTGTLPADLSDPTLKTVFSPANIPFLRQADRLDPADLARGLGPAFPALVLRGLKDVQVSAGEVQHLMTGFRANRAAVQADIPDADHLFKVVSGTPNPSVDYPDATRPFAPQVAPRLRAFLGKAL